MGSRSMYLQHVRPVAVKGGGVIELLPPVRPERESDELLAIERAGYALIPVRGKNPYTHLVKVRGDTTAYPAYLGQVKLASSFA